MRFGFAIFMVFVSAVTALAQSTMTNDKLFSSIKPEMNQSFVASNLKTRISWFSSMNPDCSSDGEIQYRILKKPSHGEISIVNDLGFPSYPNDNVRSSCNSKKLPTLNIFYKPSDGYIGEDHLEFVVLYPDGTATRWDYSIIVA